MSRLEIEEIEARSQEIEEQDKIEVIDLLRNQIFVERQLVQLYEDPQSDIHSRLVRRLLHMIQLDSRARARNHYRMLGTE